MRIPPFLRTVGGVAVVAGLIATAFITREQLLPLIAARSAPAKGAESAPAPIQEAKVLKLSPQARQNLGLVSKAAKPQTYWRTIQVPGAVVDRPGRSDRGVTTPAVGAVVQIHAFPGDTVKPGDSSSRCGCSASTSRTRSRNSSRPRAKLRSSKSSMHASKSLRRVVRFLKLG